MKRDIYSLCVAMIRLNHRHGCSGAFFLRFGRVPASIFAAAVLVGFAAARPASAEIAAHSATSSPPDQSAGGFQWSWTAPAAAPSAVGQPDASYEALVRENLQLRGDIEQVARQLRDLRQENAALQLQVRDLEQKRTGLAAALREVRTSDEVAAELTRLRAAKFDAEVQIARLTQELKSGPASPAQPSTPQPGSDLYKRIEKENMEFRARIADLTDKLEKETAARTNAEAAARRSDELATQLAKAQDLARKNEAALSSFEARQKTEIDQLRLQLKEAREEASGLRNEIAAASLAERKAAREAIPILTNETRIGASRFISPAETPRTAKVVIPGGAARTEEVQAHHTSALQHARAGKYRDAERMYLKALSADTSNAAIHYNLGILYQQGLHDPEKAAFHYRKYLEFKPDASDADTVRGWLMELQMGL